MNKALLLFPLALASLAKDPVKVAAFSEVKEVAPGGELRVALRLTMDRGWHVQSHWPSEGYIATTWKLDLPQGFEALTFYYPQGEEEKAAGDRIIVYNGEAVLGAKLRVASTVAPGSYKIDGSLRYQACDAGSCQVPKDVPTALEVEVRAGAAAPRQHPEVFRQLEKLREERTSAAGGTTKDGGLAKEISEKGLLLTLLGIFLLGLGLNLTPCVYPVIAVTVGFFSRQTSGGGRILLPLLYGLGIALTFTVLGVLTALTGGIFGTWLQSAWVQLGLAALIFAFGLSSFGLFEIQAPSWLLNKVGGGKAGGLGALLMGLTMGVTAAPCVGPFIISLLLYVAQKGELWTGFVWFGTLSLGLALPYPILGFFSTSLQSLPKAGDWTEWVKRLMGILLFAVALFFLSSVLFPKQLLLAFAALTLLGGIYISLFEKTGREGKAVWFARGALLVLALFGAKALYAQHNAYGIEWRPYEERLLAEAELSDKPVVIDFTATWCNPCRGLEAFTFRDPGAVRESERFLRLQVDMSNQTDPVAKAAYDRFQLGGLPTIIFLNSEGNEVRELRVQDYIGPEEFLQRLRKIR